jgi:hypothetical protein
LKKNSTHFYKKRQLPLKALLMREIYKTGDTKMKKLLVGLFAIILVSLAIQARSNSFNGANYVGGMSSPNYLWSTSSNENSGYEYLFAGKRYYYENPRSGYQLRADFCSSGAFELDEMTSYGLDETRGRWAVVEYEGTVYLILATSEGRSAYPVYRGSQPGYMRVGEMEFEVTQGSCR